MRTLIITLLCSAIVLTVSACGPTTATQAQTAQAKIQPPDLINTEWQLVRIQSMDDAEYVPDDASKYQIAFLPEGLLQVIADCNRGRGQWAQTGTNQLLLSQIAATRAACGPNSLSSRFLSDLGHIRSFVYANGHIFLASMADGAILEFAPIE